MTANGNKTIRAAAGCAILLLTAIALAPTPDGHRLTSAVDDVEKITRSLRDVPASPTVRLRPIRHSPVSIVGHNLAAQSLLAGADEHAAGVTTVTTRHRHGHAALNSTSAGGRCVVTASAQAMSDTHYAPAVLARETGSVEAAWRFILLHELAHCYWNPAAPDDGQTPHMPASASHADASDLEKAVSEAFADAFALLALTADQRHPRSVFTAVTQWRLLTTLESMPHRAGGFLELDKLHASNLADGKAGSFTALRDAAVSAALRAALDWQIAQGVDPVAATAALDRVAARAGHAIRTVSEHPPTPHIGHLSEPLYALPEPLVYPRVLPAGQPALLNVALQITDHEYLAGSARLVAYPESTGRAQVLARDTGRRVGGALARSDVVFQVGIKGDATEAYRVHVEALFGPTQERRRSHPVVIRFAGAEHAAAASAVVSADRVDFIYPDGTAGKALFTTRITDGETSPVVKIAAVADNLQRVMVHHTGEPSKQPSAGVHDGAGQRWKHDYPADTILIPAGVTFSTSGHHSVVVFHDAATMSFGYEVVDDSGTIVAEKTGLRVAPHDVRISQDARHIAWTGEHTTTVYDRSGNTVWEQPFGAADFGVTLDETAEHGFSLVFEKGERLGCTLCAPQKEPAMQIPVSAPVYRNKYKPLRPL